MAEAEMETEDETYAALLSRLEEEPSSVPRLPPAWRRALVLVPYALFVLAVLLVARGIRRDADALGPWVLWGLGAIQLAAGYGIFRFLLNESLPGRSTRASAWLAVLGLVLSLQLGVAQWSFQRSPLVVAPERFNAIGVLCLGAMTLIGLPLLLLGLALVSRGLPQRPRLSGLLAGLTGGLVAEAVFRSHCPYSELTHVAAWHSGAVMLLGTLGFFAGVAFGLRAEHRWAERRSRTLS